MSIRIPVRWEQIRDSGRRKLFIVPFIFTFANACLGLLSVLYAWDDQYTIAAICIICAAFFDMCDGRLARALGSCSLLGTELDSLCDAISFCFAPVILVHGMILSSNGIAGIITGACFLCAGLFRLARFNNSSYQQKAFFMGMSTPVAAVFVSLLIIHKNWLMNHHLGYIFNPYLFMMLILAIAYCMVSSIPFPTFKTGFCIHRSTRLITSFIAISCACALVFKVPIFLAIVTSYIVSTMIIHKIFHA